jgi:hypothetical protein
MTGLIPRRDLRIAMLLVIVANQGEKVPLSSPIPDPFAHSGPAEPPLQQKERSSDPSPCSRFGGCGARNCIDQRSTKLIETK